MSRRNVCIIAEAGVNHNGSLDLALSLVDAAADAGADVVKFQSFKSTALVSRFAQKAEYQKAATDGAESQLQMLQQLELGEEALVAIIDKCRARNVEFLSTPFEAESLETLVTRLGVARLKLGSGELTNAPLLLAAGRAGLPIILSTGMSDLGEVEAALGVLAFGYLGYENPGPAAFARAFASRAGRELLARQVVLLHCTTEYPAPFEDVNLRAMETLRSTFGLDVGFSDHTPGIAIAGAAVALGASVVEKHMTLDRGMKGPDHRASIEPAEFADMVRDIRRIEMALGSGDKVIAPSERKNVAIARKSIVSARAIAQGEPFTADNLTVKRPGTGISPYALWDLIGQPATRAYEIDELIER